MIEIDLTDENLFGNEVAEDEDEAVFLGYAVERPEVSAFFNKAKPIQVVRAYKGEGKSALLRLLSNKVKSLEDGSILVKISGSSIAPSIQSESSDEWVRKWKENILRLVANEIGARVEKAYSDDAISLVEEAEMNGFRARGFVSSVFDRLKTPSVPIDRQRAGVTNPEKLLERWQEKRPEVWIVIDDVDQNFENNTTHCLKVATFFIAARQITNQIPDFIFRASVRPNVWSIVKRKYEALSHVEQYITDIRWNQDDYFDLLAKRADAHFARRGRLAEVNATLPADEASRKKAMVAQIFRNPMPWGKKQKHPAEILYTLSWHRPRWLVELAKVSASLSVKKSHTVIEFDDINEQLISFGKKRIDDTIAEFRSQCPQIEELITAFSGQDELMPTDVLIKTITDRVLQGVNLKIEGVVGRPSAKEIAHFLYQVGFITARFDKPEGGYDHIAYADNPDLLASRTNIDQGHKWEIHPVFRQALKLKNV